MDRRTHVPGVRNEIGIKHLHRYALARDLAPDTSVLDSPCGEGFESDLPAPWTVKWHPNLQSRPGSRARISVGSASIDLVVSFEPLEHRAEHAEMMREVKRTAFERWCT